MHSGRNGKNQSILTHHAPIGLAWKPKRRRHISLTNAPLPEDMRPLPPRPRAKGQRNKPHRLPKVIRIKILRTPAAEQLAPVRRTLEHRAKQRRRAELALRRPRDI